MRPSKLLRLAADACAVSVGIISLAALRVIAQRQRKSRLSTGALYRLPVRSNLALSLLLFAADLCAIPAILRSKKNLSAVELDAVKAAAVPVFDRVALRQIFADKDEWKSISDSVSLAIILMPALLLLHKEVRSSVRLLFTLYAKTHAITYTLYSFSPLGPALQDKYRPVVYYLNEPHSSRAAGNNRNAMYSGHTGNAACASFFAAKVLSDYYPNLNAGKRFSLFALALVPPVLLGICRIKALRHFPADVALAILIGGSCGVLVPEAHRAG